MPSSVRISRREAEFYELTDSEWSTASCLLWKKAAYKISRGKTLDEITATGCAVPRNAQKLADSSGELLPADGRHSRKSVAGVSEPPSADSSRAGKPLVAVSKYAQKLADRRCSRRSVADVPETLSADSSHVRKPLAGGGTCRSVKAKGEKRAWSEEEIQAVKSRKTLLALMLPGKQDIEAMQQEHPILHSRFWRNIKDYFRNDSSKLLALN
ncbi:uncharacterized protein LOC110984258 [Acanthaster planci]|uniref:Uncharacterized protein LOC110984258 n=1 Tax=Acanthaster planci TaxID=133434 RepID=A0A8B7Z2U5_ACAPL|nr:uncharacterized protein LOC110984258 [Acanthaster planci]